MQPHPGTREGLAEGDVSQLGRVSRSRSGKAGDWRRAPWAEGTILYGSGVGGEGQLRGKSLPPASGVWTFSCGYEGAEQRMKTIPSGLTTAPPLTICVALAPSSRGLSLPAAVKIK